MSAEKEKKPDLDAILKNLFQEWSKKQEKPITDSDIRTLINEGVNDFITNYQRAEFIGKMYPDTHARLASEMHENLIDQIVDLGINEQGIDGNALSYFVRLEGEAGDKKMKKGEYVWYKLMDMVSNITGVPKKRIIAYNNFWLDQFEND